MTREEVTKIVQEKISGLQNATYNLIEVDGVYVATITFIPTRTEKVLTDEEWEKWWALSEKIFGRTPLSAG